MKLESDPPTKQGVGVLAYALAVGVALVAILPLAHTGPGRSTKIFEDVTVSSGLSEYSGMTFGAAWGDFDGDGLPDLYVTNHLNGAKLFKNLGHGHFKDVTNEWFAPKDLTGDKHGAAWADVFNDGRLDLVQLMGAERGVGSEPKRFFVNRGTRFEEMGDAVGISNAFGRTRMPLWFDFDHDGRLDLFQGAETRFDDRTPPFFFMQRQDKSFAPSDDVATFASRSVPFCIIADLSNTASPDLVCRVFGKDKAMQVFSTATLPMKELDLVPQTAFEDIAAGDFNNDGSIGLFLARKYPAPPVSLGRPASNELVADVWIDQTNVVKPLGFKFRSSGQLGFRVAPESAQGVLALFKVHIGARDITPAELTFSLSAEAEGVAGMAPVEPGSQSGLYVGLTQPDQWQVLVSGARDALAGDKSKYQQIAVKITSSDAITDVEVIGDPPKPEEAPFRLFINRNGKLVEESDKWGVNVRPVSAVSVVAGDFNNDMHLDLFVLVSGEIGKQQNLLLLNRGDGHFDVIPGAGGAGGGKVGVGDSVTVADFDSDGFLDILVTTGGSMGRSMGLPSEAGAYHLYHNVGNGNHWLEIDLEGTKSNRDGIGARVQLTAGGVTQTRIQDGGIHNHGQNHFRLHFGLAKYTKADKINVRWPSGTTQELTDVKADQILRIKEP